MRETVRVLVFPAAGPVGREIHDALSSVPWIALLGGTSGPTDATAPFDEVVVIEELDSPGFIASIRRAVSEHAVDLVYPALDEVADVLADESDLPLIGAVPGVARVTSSKRRTLELLAGAVPVPRMLDPDFGPTDLPAFVKPDRGHGSRGIRAITTPLELAAHREADGRDGFVVTELLPGDEWTVDCFSDRRGVVRFVGPRRRLEIRNGTAVVTEEDPGRLDEFRGWAERIQAHLGLRGAWFFQARGDRDGAPRLLEVSMRPAGSSGVWRSAGVNLPLLGVLDHLDEEVEVMRNAWVARSDRPLTTRIVVPFRPTHLYVDLDDCLVVRGHLNWRLIGLLHRARAARIRLTLITKHAGDPITTLEHHRVPQLFDEVIHLTEDQRKSDHIDPDGACLVDDSFRERREAAERLGIPVLGTDMLDTLEGMLAQPGCGPARSVEPDRTPRPDDEAHR